MLLSPTIYRCASAFAPQLNKLYKAQKCIVIARIKPRQAQMTFDRLGEGMSDRRCQAKQGREEHEPLRTYQSNPNLSRYTI